MTPSALEAPYPLLADLPRSVWLHGIVTGVGQRAQRLSDMAAWLAALGEGQLPPAQRHFGDPQAVAPMRRAIGELGLASMARNTPALAEQLLRTLMWHLDRIADLQPRLTRDDAIAEVTRQFRQAWQLEKAGLEDHLALLRQLGHHAEMNWDMLRGHLRSRPWQEARAAADRLAELPALTELIRKLGRAERSGQADPAPQRAAQAHSAQTSPVRAVQTRLPNEPGDITGIRWSARIERMVSSEAVMLRHPVLKKLWRVRHAEGRLLSWETEAVLSDWRADLQAAAPQAVTPPSPEPLERGPIILCLDTSGSMQGAPERIAKAVVIAALRAAHEAGRGCKLLAFGGPGEVVEQDLAVSTKASARSATATGPLQALMDLMGQSFDGGTDIQTPIERAIDRVHDERWRSADILIVSDGEFGCVPATLERLDHARAQWGLRVQGVLVGDRETLGLLEVCDHIHWVREWRRFDDVGSGSRSQAFSPVHSKSLTALYFPNALSDRASRAHRHVGSGALSGESRAPTSPPE